MTLQDFIDEFRRVLDDGPRRNPQMWDDEEIIRYLNSAVDEACERALLIEDRLTAACCTIPLVAGQSEYPLHAAVLKVKRVAHGGRVLDETSVEELDCDLCGWETMAGRPTHYISTSTQSIRLVRTPRAADITAAPALALTVYRTPLVPFTLDDIEAELLDIYPRDHLRLLPWAYHLAYMKRDSQTFDPVKADAFDAEFTRSFGPKPTANVRRKQRDKRPPVVKMRW